MVIEGQSTPCYGLLVIITTRLRSKKGFTKKKKKREELSRFDQRPCPSAPDCQTGRSFHLLSSIPTYRELSKLQLHNNMALQTGVSTSKALILVGAGLTGSVILRSGHLSDVILQLQEIMKGVNEAEISPGKYDAALLAAQIRNLAQEIRELTLSRPITILNGNSDTSGNLASYLVPAAAVGAMGYCYMWWKGWSFSDVMFVTKQNMASAVANVSKQLEHVSTVLASTKRHLTEKLENLDGKLDEQKEVTKLVMTEVHEVKSDLSQIGFDIELIHQMVSGLEGKIDLLENKQDITNSGLWYLCQFAGGVKDGLNAKLFQDVSAKLPLDGSAAFDDKELKGLQFITENNKIGDLEKSEINTRVQKDGIEKLETSNLTTKNRVHRSYPINISSRGFAGLV